MFAAHASNVLFVTVRIHNWFSSIHGPIAAPSVASIVGPKPKMKYASSAVIAVSNVPFGIAST